MELVWAVDQRVQQAINVGMRSDFFDSFFRFVTYIGLDYVALPFVALLILIKSTRGCGVQCITAYAIGGLAAMVIKFMSPRFRPGYPGDGVFVAPDEQIYLNSFPSGHSVVAFAIAFTLLMAWPGRRRTAIGLTALVLALLVGISRVYRGVHWPTDVLASVALAGLAAIAAHWILTPVRARESQRPSAEPALDQP